MVFNGEQKLLLKELSRNPVWGSVLKDMETHLRRKIRYKKDDKDELKKLHELIHAAGMDQQLDNVIGLLTYDN